MTIVSAIVAGLFLFYPLGEAMQGDIAVQWMLVFSSLSLIFIPFSFFFSFRALQKAAEYSTFAVLTLFSKDKWVRFISLYLSVFALLTFFYVLGEKLLKSPFTLALWIVGAGSAIDCMLCFFKRLMRYLNPYQLLDLFAFKKIEGEVLLCQAIDNVFDVAIKAIDSAQASLCHHALNSTLSLIKNYLQKKPSLENLSFILFYLYQRLEVIFERSISAKMEMTSSAIINLTGKQTLDVSLYEMKASVLPLQFLGKFALAAQKAGFKEVQITTSCLYSEVAKSLIEREDIANLQIKDPFFALINGLEILVKGIFQRDKSTDIALLKQPFQELKSALLGGKVKENADTAIILQSIERVLLEFEALQRVMATRPQIPKV